MQQVYKWIDRLRPLNIFFITAEVKRGIGLEDLLPNYHIICAKSDPIIAVLKKQGTRIFCLEEEGISITDRDNNAGRILDNKNARDYIKTHAKNTPYIAFFKPSPKLDALIFNLGLKSLGNSSVLNELFENKIKSFLLLKDVLSENVIPSVTGKIEDLRIENLAKNLGLPCVIQFGHGWAGKTTFLIRSESDLIDLHDKFTKTTVRASRYVAGITILNNCCIFNDRILVGPPALQISGLSELDENPFATCGRQWPLTSLDSKQVQTVTQISKTAGKLMMKAGFKGYFGMDFILEKNTGKVFVSEINARMTASTPFYTKLERAIGLIPLLAYHFGAFTEKDIPVSYDEKGLRGSQVIVRNPLTSRNYNELPLIGTYRYKDGTIFLENKSYHPEKLEENQFILLRRTSGTSSDSEKIRIETKQEVVTSEGKPLIFLHKIISDQLLK